MVAQTQIGSTYQVVQFPLVGTDYGNSNGTLHVPGESGIADYAAPAGGWIIGLSGATNADLTTGTITHQPTIDGSLCPAFDADAALIYTGQQTAYHMQDAGEALYRFEAGERIGVAYQASDTLNPTTVDGAVMVIALLDEVRY